MILPFPDRRRYRRQVIEVDVAVFPESGGELRAISIDVNDYGMAAIVMGEVRPGERVRIRFKEPGHPERFVEREAVVRGWDGRHGGFEFLQGKRAVAR